MGDYVEHSLLSSDRRANGGTMDEPVLRLDDLTAKLALDRVDFLKLGAESRATGTGFLVSLRTG